MLPETAPPGFENYIEGLYPNLKKLCNDLRGGDLEDFQLRETLGRTLFVKCAICDTVIDRYVNNNTIAADDLPEGLEWERMERLMWRHLFEQHGCTLSGDVGRPVYYEPLQCPAFGKPNITECCIHTSHGTRSPYDGHAFALGHENAWPPAFFLNWFDVFKFILAARGADGVLIAPQASEEETARIEASKKLWEFFLIHHALKCEGSIFNVIYSRRVFDIPKMLSRVYWTLRLTTTALHFDALHLVFIHLLTIEVNTCAAAHNTQPDVVFGLLYLWLLHDTQGRNPMVLYTQANGPHTRKLFEIAVGQLCKTRFDELQKFRAEELLQKTGRVEF